MEIDEKKRKEFLDKWTTIAKPPKDNVAEKNQEGSLDSYQTVRQEIEKGKNHKRRRKLNTLSIIRDI